MKHSTFLKRLTASALAVVMTTSLGLPVSASAVQQKDGGFTVKQVPNSAVSADLSTLAARDQAAIASLDPEDEVRVSIIMEELPTLALYSAEEKGNADLLSNTQAMDYRAALKLNQEDVAQVISDDVLGGEELDVVWNLTLAANAMSANVKAGEIEAIREVPGVAEVLVETRVHPMVYSMDKNSPKMEISTDMTGSSQAWANGYTGAGRRVAVIDTGLDILHQSFDNEAFLYAIEEDAMQAGMTYEEYVGPDQKNLLDPEELNELIPQLHAFERRPDMSAEAGAYYNEKLPYVFNYTDNDYDVEHLYDEQGEHGSHVCGIASANRYLETADGEFVSAMDTVHMVGNAPDSQLLVMKIFGKGGGCYDSDYMAALEDSIVLGCDAANLSIGTWSNGTAVSEYYQDLMNHLVNTNTIMSVSNSNCGHFMGNTYVPLPYADEVQFQTACNPAALTNSMGVASVDSNGIISAIFQAGPDLEHMNSVCYAEDTAGYFGAFESLTSLNGQTLDYIYLDGFGYARDWEKLDIEGKVVICQRGGTTSMLRKCNVAAGLGAAAVIICDNGPGVHYLSLSGYNYTTPAVMVSQFNGERIRDFSTFVPEQDGVPAHYVGKFQVNGEFGMNSYNRQYQRMSDFSSWGCPSDLSMKPEITTPGGNVYSVWGRTVYYGASIEGGHDTYTMMSGTSMAAPQITGISALVRQAIEERGIHQEGLTDRALSQSLMMSTAKPLLMAEDQYYPVLQQGAGLAASDLATSADSYLLVDGVPDGKVKAELGDDPERTGLYTFDFTVHNLDGEKHTYYLSSDVFTQAVIWSDDYNANMLDTSTAPLENVTTFTVNGEEARSVDVPANGTGSVHVEIQLDDTAIAHYSELCPKGFYVQAYVHANGTPTADSAAGTEHSIPVLAFFGSWTDSSMYDTGSYVDHTYGIDTRRPHVEEYTNISNVLSVRRKGDTSDSFLAGNPYLLDDEYLPERNAFNNTNGDVITEYLVTATRNANNSFTTVTGDTFAPVINETGSLLGLYCDSYSYYSYGCGIQGLPLNWTGTDGKGNLLPEGTEAKVSVTLIPELYADKQGVLLEDKLATLSGGATLTTPVVIDNTAPVGGDLTLEGHTLTVEAQDNRYVAAVALLDATGTKVLAMDTPNQTEAGVLTTVELDLSAVTGKVFLLQVADYAKNTTTYELTFNEGFEPALADAQALLDYVTGKVDSLPEDVLTDADLDGEITTHDAYVLLNLQNDPELELVDQPTEVKLSASSLDILEGHTEALNAYVLPWNLTNRDVMYLTSDENVATVDENGVITAHTTGTCQITVKSLLDPSVMAVCDVTVYTITADLTGSWAGGNDEVYWFNANTDDMGNYTVSDEQAGARVNATADAGDVVYVSTLNESGSMLWHMDPETKSFTKIAPIMWGDIADLDQADGTNSIYELEYIVDLAYGQNMGKLVGIYHNMLYIINPDDARVPLYLDYGESYAYMIGIASIGTETIDGVDYDAFVLLDSEGNLYRAHFALDAEGNLIGSTSAYDEGALIGNIGVMPEDDYKGNTLHYTVTEEGQPYLFWTTFVDGDPSVYAIRFDETLKTDLLASYPVEEVYYLTGLMDGFVPGKAPETFASDAELADAALAALDLGAGFRFDDYEVSRTDKTVTVDIAAATETTNGLMKVTYDPKTLKFTEARNASSTLVSAAKDGKHTVTLGYADMEQAPAGSVVATLVFSYEGGALDTDLTLADQEFNTQTGLTGADSLNVYEKATKPEIKPEPKPEPEPEVKPEDRPLDAFVDLDRDQWYSDNVDFVIEEGLMAGTSADRFSPEMPLTRAMFVTILHRIEGTPKAVAAGYTDVAADTWYAAAIDWATESGVVSGVGNHCFAPEAPITREQMASMLDRYAEYKGMDMTAAADALASFVDADLVSDWASDAMGWAVTNKLISGKTGNQLDPLGGASRIEAAAVLARFCELMGK